MNLFLRSILCNAIIIVFLCVTVKPTAAQVLPNTTYSINSTLPTSGTNFQTLPEAITALNATVPSPVDVVFSIEDETIDLVDAQVIKNPVTIKGSTVNPNGSPAIVIYQSNSKYHFHDSIFANNLVIQDLVLIGPNATFTEGGVASTGTNNIGGGVFTVTTSGLLTITNCIVGGCYDPINGGGVLAAKPLQLENTTFSYNKTGGSNGSGGGVYAFAALTLKGANVFTNNVAEGQFGGAIYKGANGAFTTTDLTSLIVDGNTSNFGGGGILTFVGLDLTTAQNVSITNNKTLNGDGGGIYAVNTLALANAVISNNIAAGNGGGIYASEELVLKKNMVFEDNVANDDGGAIYKLATGNFTTTNINSLIINRNTATIGSGGGVYTSVSLDGQHKTSISNNTCGSTGGGIYTSETIILSNLSILNNVSKGSGGGIYTTSALTLENDTVSGNRAGYDVATGNFAGTNTGGGIYAKKALTLSGNIVIANNTANSYGGGLHLENGGTGFITTNLTSLTVTGNTCRINNGGGICTESALTLNTLQPSIFSGNQALSGDGGALSCANTALNFTNVTIDNNLAGKNGGGIRSMGAIIFTNVSVKNNIARTSGGGIHTTGTLTLENDTISNNKAGYDIATGNYVLGANQGGGVFVSGILTLRGDIVFQKNIVGGGLAGTGSGGGGGAIFAGNTIDASGVTSVLIDSNSAVAAITATSLPSGGGIFTTAAFSLGKPGVRTMISNNSASGGGGGIHTSGALKLENDSIINNKCGAAGGGGIYSNAPLTLSNTTFSGNVSVGIGGGIAVGGDSLILKGNVVFDGNMTTGGSGHGGGIYFSAKNLNTTELISLKVTNNKGINGGGWCFNGSGSFTLDGTNSSIIISKNTASRGAGINLNNTSLTLKNIRTEDNTASASGGGIQSAGPLTLKNISLSRNKSAGSNGGALFINGTLFMQNCTLDSNTALVGGAIYTAVTDNTIQNSTFSQNRATSGNGGAIYSSGIAVGTVKVTLSTFNGNTATGTGNAIYNANAASNELKGNIIYGNGTGLEITTIPSTISIYNIVCGQTLPGTGNKNITTGNADSIFTNTSSANLAVLGNNGGFTRTLNIKYGGSAHNFIPTSVSSTWGIATDQRDSTRSIGCEADAGSVEIQTADSSALYTLKPNTRICYNNLLNPDTLVAFAQNMKDTAYFSNADFLQEITSLPLTITTQNKIYVKFISTSNCELYDTISLNIIPKPTLSFNSRTVTICSDSSVNLIATTTNSTGILWTNYSSTGSATGEITDTLRYTANPRTSDTTFYIFATVQGNSPCGSFTDSVTVTVKATASVRIEIAQDTNVCNNRTIDLSAVTTGTIGWYGWYDANGQPDNTEQYTAPHNTYVTYDPDPSEAGTNIKLFVRANAGVCGYVSDTIHLRILPMSTNASLELIAQPLFHQTVCTDTVYEVKIKATDLGDLKNMKLKFDDYSQTSITRKYALIKQPYTAAVWDTLRNFTSDVTGTTWTLPDTLKQGDSLQVQMVVSAECGFLSGSNFKITFNTQTLCDDNLAEKSVSTSNFNIKQDITQLNSYGITSTFAVTTGGVTVIDSVNTVNSNSNDTVTWRMVAVVHGPQPTDSLRERMEAFIPRGLTVIQGSYNPIRNAITDTSLLQSITDTAGTRFIMPIKSGLTEVNNDTIIVELKFYATGAPCKEYNTFYNEINYSDTALCNTTPCLLYEKLGGAYPKLTVQRYTFSLDSVYGKTTNNLWNGQIIVEAGTQFYAGDSIFIDFYIDRDSNSTKTSGDTLVRSFTHITSNIATQDTFRVDFDSVLVEQGKQLLAVVRGQALCSQETIPIATLMGVDTLCQYDTAYYYTVPNMQTYKWNVIKPVDAVSGATPVRIPLEGSSNANYANENVARIVWKGKGNYTVWAQYSLSTIPPRQIARTFFDVDLTPAVTFKRLRTPKDSVCSPGIVKIYADTVLNAASRLWTASTAVGSLSGETTDTLTYNLLPRTNDTTIWIYFTAYGLESCGDKTDSIKLTVYATLQQGIPVDTTLCYGNSYTFKFLAATGGHNNTYQWQDSTKSNAWADISLNATDTNYTTPILTDSTWYRRIVTNNCGLKDTSSIAKVRVLPALNTGRIASRGQIICESGTILIISSDTIASGGSSQLVYRWLLNGTEIPNTNSATYMPTLTIPGTYNYTREIKDTVCTNYYQASAGLWVLQINGALNGDYVVGNVPFADFSTLKEAADRYNTCGISGYSRLIISSDLNETETVEFLGTALQSETNTLTIVSDGAKREIKFKKVNP